MQQCEWSVLLLSFTTTSIQKVAILCKIFKKLKTEWKTIKHQKCFRCLNCNILLFHEKLILNLMATIPCCWWEQRIAGHRSVTWPTIKRASRRCFKEVKMSRCLPICRELCANCGSIAKTLNMSSSTVHYNKHLKFVHFPRLNVLRPSMRQIRVYEICKSLHSIFMYTSSQLVQSRVCTWTTKKAARCTMNALPLQDFDFTDFLFLIWSIYVPTMQS